MCQVESRVLKNEEISKGYFRLSLESPELAEKAVPGQFVMLRVGDSYDPLLRRPFSIHRICKGKGIEILYKVVGKGTGMMAHIKEGEVVSLIGPLGNGFSIQGGVEEAVVVGGGIGAAPMLALVEELKSREKRRVTVFLGGRSKGDILCVDEFRQVGAEIQIATDDGSLGYKGFVTELLENYLSSYSSLVTRHSSLILSCGPHLMSRKVAEISKKFNIPCRVSLEAHMACGVGACLGCVIKVRSQGSGKGTVPELRAEGRRFGTVPGINSRLSCGCDSDFVPCDTQLPETSYKRVCMEGPVFDAEEVIWD